MTHAMKPTLDERRQQETAVGLSGAAVVRTSLITQLYPVARGDRALHDLLQLLAETVAEYASLPEIRFIPTGSQSALAIITALWPERITVKLTALATPVPQRANRAFVIVSAIISCESAPRARALADALLAAVPSTTVTRITSVTPPLVPLPTISNEEETGTGDVQVPAENTNAGRTSRLAIGWSVIQ